MSTVFPTDFHTIQERLSQIRPIAYISNRNFIAGDVTYLSPYISRGVISTKQIFEHCVSRGFDLNQIEKFIQELAWRDYWQRVWQEKNIDENIKNTQTNVSHFDMPTAVLEGKTSILAIDYAIKAFFETGYLHNHVRMYIASISTNLGGAHWKTPAKWMYYHLLDGDWASNALSWQWVCGANSGKKYYANQENINRFCKQEQKGTFLDTSYEELPYLRIPTELSDISKLDLKTILPKTSNVVLENKSTALYTWYNMDPEWRKEENINRILILEPSHFEKYPISENSLEFLVGLSENIENIQIHVGEFLELKNQFPTASFIYKEHPTNKHFEGVKDERDWLSNVTGYYPSFFGFWKKIKKEIF